MGFCLNDPNFVGIEKTWCFTVLFKCVCFLKVIKSSVAFVTVSYFEPEIRMCTKYYDDKGDETSLDSLTLTAEVASKVSMASDPTPSNF